MIIIESRLLKRLKQLPPGRVAHALDFVEFLIARECTAAIEVRA